MRKLFFPFLFLFILIGCQKKMNDSLPADSEQKLAEVRSNNSLLNEVNNVVTPEAPPTSVSSDLTVMKPDGSGVTVITASEYNALEPIDQIYYSGLRNAFQYLFLDAANVSSSLQFNADGSYIIIVNTDPPGENPDDDGGAGGSCTVCGLKSAFSCRDKVKKYMTDNNLTTITATISLVTVDGDNCVKIVYKDAIEPPAPPSEGTIVETYTPPPTTTPPNPPAPPTWTFPFWAFDDYIADVKYWASYMRPAGEEPIPDPSGWTRPELISFINEFNTAPSHPAHTHQYNAAFQTQLTYYVNYLWIANPVDTE